MFPLPPHLLVEQPVGVRAIVPAQRLCVYDSIMCGLVLRLRYRLWHGHSGRDSNGPPGADECQQVGLAL